MLDIINESGIWIDPTPLEKIVSEICALEIPDVDYELSILICESAKMRNLNRSYRGLDQTTDVLGFKAENLPGDYAKGIRGDIVVDIKQADNQKGSNSLETELAHLVIHGLLHLLGYDHIKKTDKEKMENKEKLFRKKLTGAY